jgi:cytoskeletal protein RodZ
VGTPNRKSELPPLVEIGQRIQTARKRRRMSVARLADRTKVSSRYIEHIEAGEFYKLPGKSYVIGFTRSIYRALELDHSNAIEALKSEMYPNHRSEMEPSVAPRGQRTLLTRLVDIVKFTSSRALATAGSRRNVDH